MFMKRKINLWNRPVSNPSDEALRYVKNMNNVEENAIEKKATRPEVASVTQSVVENQPPKKTKKAINPNVTQGDPTYFRENDDTTIHPDDLIDLSHVKIEKRGRSSSTLKRSQVRRNTLSVSVSEEEEALLRKGAANAGMGFSAWARKILFNSLRRKIPKRPTN